MLTPEQTAAIKKRADRATPGEWYTSNVHKANRLHPIVAGVPPAGMLVRTTHTGGIYPLFDQEFIAAARADVPALCDTIDALRAELAAARDALTTPPLARVQPCGCVVCFCDGTERCYGCGAKSCNTTSCVFTSAETRQQIVYDTAPSYAQLRAENGRLRQLGTEIRNRLKNHARTLDLDDWALASIRACDAWDSALAALDQEREGK